MLTYNLDIEPGSLWLRTTPGETALSQPYFCSEAGVFYARRDFNTARSFKDNYILFCTIDGCGMITQKGQTVELHKNEALLMNCRFPQSYKTKDESWQHYWIHIDGAGVKAMESILIPDGKLTPVSLSAQSADLHFNTILKNLETDSVQSILIDSLEIHQLLTMMSSSLMKKQEENTGTAQLILEAADHIRLHYREELDLDALLSLTHLSRSYFLHMFKKVIGTTPHAYLLACRITRCKFLLETTDKPIALIAEETGFRDPSSLSVRFSAIVGQSPLKYRNNALHQQSL
ncbi:MAG: helix-turn-helix domain-containing protein [Solobacterium sp.]|nr:helix-turn-helix domain-containing protein [Solobacterium sp.]